MGSHQGPDVPSDVRELVDRLGRAFVNAIMADEAGRELVQRINESGFEVGILLEATVALHQRDPVEDTGEDSPACPFRLGRTAEPGGAGLGFDDSFEWSEEDRALLCNFRISLD